MTIVFARRRVQALLLATCLVALNACQALAASSEPRVFIEQQSAQVLAILQAKELTSPEKVAKIERIADQSFDFETTARLTLGRNWNDLTPAQQTEFVAEFRRHLSVTYGKNVETYRSEKIEILGDREEARGDWVVKSKLLLTGRDDALVDYRLRRAESGWRMIDVIIEGIGLVSNFRAQFQDVITRKGAPHLISLLREKNQKGESLIDTRRGAKRPS